MINKKLARHYCCEDISLIENYEAAIADQTQTWHCHHRWETDRGLSPEELIFCCEYDYVPADRLIFLTASEHSRMHALSNVRGTRWWNNGVINKRAKECPGNEYKRGKL